MISKNKQVYFLNTPIHVHWRWCWI